MFQHGITARKPGGGDLVSEFSFINLLLRVHVQLLSEESEASIYLLFSTAFEIG